jgi:hypothetical protein
MRAIQSLSPLGVAAIVAWAALVTVGALLVFAQGSFGGARATEGGLAVALNGSDSNPCTVERPCATFDRAYHVARPGQVVAISSGSYPPQTLTPDVTKTSADDVVFEPAQGATVRLDAGLPPGAGGSGLTILGAKHVTFSRLTIVGLLTIVPSTRSSTRADTLYPSDLSFLSGRLDGYFTIRGADGVVFQDMTIGNYTLSDANPRIAGVPKLGNYEDQPESTNTVFSRVTFENIVRPPGVRTHAECLFLDGGVSGLRITQSRFTNCAVIDIFVYKGNGRAPSNVLLENNWLDSPRDSNGNPAGVAINFKQFPPSFPATANWTIRFNSLRASIVFKCFEGAGCASSWRNVVVSSNVAVSPSFGSCLPPGAKGVTFDHNVWSGRSCSATDVTAPPGFLAVDGFDFRLRPGAAAVGAGALEGRPAFDIDGRMRPRLVAPDAGAVQRETAEIVLARSIGGVALGATRNAVRGLYGAPRKSLRSKHGAVAAPVRIELLRVPHGLLRVIYANERVVGLATASRYYSTRAGLGPGAALATAGPLAETRCEGGYRRRLRGRGVYVLEAESSKIASVLMVRRGYELACGRKAGKP